MKTLVTYLLTYLLACLLACLLTYLLTYSYANKKTIDKNVHPNICSGFVVNYIYCTSICYSNFDKHHYIDFHWFHCTEPTPLSLDNF